MSEIRVTNIIGETGTDAVNFSKGINVSSGIITATTFSGSGANLTSLPAAQLTGTLPAINGSNLTNVSAGKILQIVQQYDTNFTRNAVNSNSFTATAHQVSITPTAANSKILVNISSACNNNGSGNWIFLTIYRSVNGGTFTNIAPYGSSSSTNGFAVNKMDSSRSEIPFNIMYLDSPTYSVGNAIVYKLYIRNNGSGSVEVPHSPNAEPVICIAQEVAA